MPKEMFVDRRERFGQQVARAGNVLRRLLRPAIGKSPQKVGAADDADQAAVAHHRHPLDAVRLQQPRDFRVFGVFCDPNHRSGHDIARGQLRPAQSRQKIGMQRFALGDQRQPPVAPRLPVGVAAPDQIPFADHADHHSRTIGNRRCADLMLEKPLRYLGGRSIGRDRYHVLGHDLPCLHARTCLRVSGVRFCLGYTGLS